jgi:two-component system OmpR family response regulator
LGNKHLDFTPESGPKRKPMDALIPDKTIDKPRIKIFLVDDDPLYLRILESHFNENPFLDVTSFPTGEACLDHLSQKPDVVVLDYFLNGKNKNARDGLSILRQIKKDYPDIQVIMLSSHENVEIALNCIRNNAFNFLLKNDITFIRLKHSIKQIFGIHSKVKELVVWDW